VLTCLESSVSRTDGAPMDVCNQMRRAIYHIRCGTPSLFHVTRPSGRAFILNWTTCISLTCFVHVKKARVDCTEHVQQSGRRTGAGPEYLALRRACSGWLRSCMRRHWNPELIGHVITIENLGERPGLDLIGLLPAQFHATPH
jgi:hypothetical protein